jgi:hypothetical protein
LYAELCRRFADEPLVDALVGLDPAWDAPLRLLGGLHALVLSGCASWDGVDAALEQHADFLAWAVAERPVQTNEVQRCWVLLPCFLELVRRSGCHELDLVEVGPSAGLNLVWDRYRYVYRAGEGGPTAAGLELRGEERRSVPDELLRERPRIGRRVGIDLAPVDVTTEEGALLLKSFVWADQAERLELLDRAIATLREDHRNSSRAISRRSCRRFSPKGGTALSRSSGRRLRSGTYRTRVAKACAPLSRPGGVRHRWHGSPEAGRSGRSRSGR